MGLMKVSMETSKHILSGKYTLDAHTSDYMLCGTKGGWRIVPFYSLTCTIYAPSPGSISRGVKQKI